MKKESVHHNKKTLIIIEGLPGSGKSSTATNITNYLNDKNINVKMWHENSLDNPVGFLWTYEEILKSITRSNLASYPFESWLNLTNFDSDFFVLESRLLQNLSLQHLVGGGSEQEAAELPAKVLITIEKLFDVKLIYLETTNPKEHLDRIIPSRKESHPNWIPFVTKIYDPQPLLKNRGISGESGYREMLIYWDSVQKKIVPELNCKKLILKDPYIDWDQSLSIIFDFCIN